MTELTLKAEIRDIKTDKKAKHLIEEGYLPGVIYGPQKETKTIKIKMHDFLKSLSDAGENTIISINLEDKVVPVFIHDVFRDPRTNKILHADFYEFSKLHKLKSEIPLKFIGESKAVKELGAVLSRDIDHIEIECLPEDMLHEIEIDLSMLENINDIIFVSSIKVPKGIKILNPEDQAIASAVPYEEEKVVVEETLVSTEAPKEEKTEEKTEEKK